MRSRLIIAALTIACAADAATFLVGTDRDMIRSSAAIVVTTAGNSMAMRSPRGAIETVTRMHVEEAIAGPLNAGDDFDVVELGGFLGDIGLAIAGSPRFAPGERTVLLLENDFDGAWTTKAMALGRFTFARDISGRELLIRDESEIFGWDVGGTPHQEQRRSAEAFLRFVRETAGGGDPPADYFVPRWRLVTAPDAIQSNASAPASTYLLQQSGTGIRWSSFPSPAVFLSNGSQPGAINGGLTSAQRGLAVWTNNPGSNIVYQYGGTTTARGGLQTADGVDSILFNDPNGEIKPFTGRNGDVLAIGGAWFGSATHAFNGETFFTIQEADLVVAKGIFGPGLTGPGFDHVLAHELGHTLGFRHSDQNADGGACTQPSCTSNALMSSSVDFNNDRTGATLQAWDREAAGAVYGSSGGPPPCVPPVITGQPQSSDFQNVPVALSVMAGGTGPFSYQWYVGTRGDTRQPAPSGTGPVLTVQPSQTTSYWVRVTGQCSPAADSDTATITVNGCPGVTINSISSGSTIIQGRSETISVAASSGNRALTYQWFAGPRGDTSRPVSGGTGPTIVVTPPATQSYWVQISNDCGANATSDAVMIVVTPCTAPSVVIQPANADVVSGTGATLSTTIGGTQPMQFQWFRGTPPNMTQPVPNANSSTFTTDPLFAGSTFWLQAMNPCGTVSTSAAIVRVVASCTAPAITVQPQNQTVSGGTSAILSVTATGPSLTYAWYQGPVLDFTHPVGGSAPALSTPVITAPTQFWVRITNPCGEARSVAATISPATGRRRAVRH